MYLNYILNLAQLSGLLPLSLHLLPNNKTEQVCEIIYKNYKIENNTTILNVILMRHKPELSIMMKYCKKCKWTQQFPERSINVVYNKEKEKELLQQETLYFRFITIKIKLTSWKFYFQFRLHILFNIQVFFKLSLLP